MLLSSTMFDYCTTCLCKSSLAHPGHPMKRKKKRTLRAVLMGTKSCTKILKFSTRFSCHRRFRNAPYYGEKNLLMGKSYVWARFRNTCVCPSMRGRYKIQIAKGWKWQRIFSYQEGEICKSRQSCSSTVPQPVKHRHQRMSRFYPRGHRW